MGQVEKIIKTVKLDITGFSGGATPRNCLNFNSILAKVETLMSGGNKINSQVRLFEKLLDQADMVKVKKVWDTNFDGSIEVIDHNLHDTN